MLVVGAGDYAVDGCVAVDFSAFLGNCVAVDFTGDLNSVNDCPSVCRKRRLIN